MAPKTASRTFYPQYQIYRSQPAIEELTAKPSILDILWTEVMHDARKTSRTIQVQYLLHFALLNL